MLKLQQEFAEKWEKILLSKLRKQQEQTRQQELLLEKQQLEEARQQAKLLTQEQALKRTRQEAARLAVEHVVNQATTNLFEQQGLGIVPLAPIMPSFQNVHPPLVIPPLPLKYRVQPVNNNQEQQEELPELTQAELQPTGYDQLYHQLKLMLLLSKQYRKHSRFQIKGMCLM